MTQLPALYPDDDDLKEYDIDGNIMREPMDESEEGDAFRATSSCHGSFSMHMHPNLYLNKW